MQLEELKELEESRGLQGQLQFQLQFHRSNLSIK